MASLTNLYLIHSLKSSHLLVLAHFNDSFCFFFLRINTFWLCIECFIHSQTTVDSSPKVVWLFTAAWSRCFYFAQLWSTRALNEVQIHLITLCWIKFVAVVLSNKQCKYNCNADCGEKNRKLSDWGHKKPVNHVNHSPSKTISLNPLCNSVFHPQSEAAVTQE